MPRVCAEDHPLPAHAFFRQLSCIDTHFLGASFDLKGARFVLFLRCLFAFMQCCAILCLFIRKKFGREASKMTDLEQARLTINEVDQKDGRAFLQAHGSGRAGRALKSAHQDAYLRRGARRSGRQKELRAYIEQRCATCPITKSSSATKWVFQQGVPVHTDSFDGGGHFGAEGSTRTRRSRCSSPAKSRSPFPPLKRFSTRWNPAASLTA